MFKKFILTMTCWFLLCGGNVVWGDPPSFPYKIAGTLTVDGERIVYGDDEGYEIVATHEDMTPFDPACEDADGLNDYDSYFLNIPIYDRDNAPDGAKPGDIILLHVFKHGSKFLLISPAGGKVEVGNAGTVGIVEIEALSGPTGGRLYTEEELQQRIAEEVNKWDGNRDGKVGLEDAIHALQVVSGNK